MAMPAIILFSVFVLVPIISGIHISFTNWNGYSQKYKYVGFRNYIELFQSKEVWTAFRNTIVYGFGSTIIQTILGLAFAMLLYKKFLLRTVSRTIIYIPAMVADLKAKGLAIPSEGAWVIPVAEPGDKKEIPPVILVKTANLDKYKTLDDINKAGVIIGAQKNTTKAIAAADKFPEAANGMVLESLVPTLITELKNGTVDLLVLDGNVGMSYVK